MERGGETKRGLNTSCRYRNDWARFCPVVPNYTMRFRVSKLIGGPRGKFLFFFKWSELGCVSISSPIGGESVYPVHEFGHW